AADLTADVFVAVIESAGSYRRSRGEPVAWLFGIARNVVADGLEVGIYAGQPASHLVRFQVGLAQDRVRLALADPDRRRQAAHRPLRLSRRWRRAGGLEDTQPLVVAVAARPARPRPVAEASDPFRGDPAPPLAHLVRRQADHRRDLPVRQPLLGQQRDPRPLD